MRVTDNAYRNRQSLESQKVMLRLGIATRSSSLMPVPKFGVSPRNSGAMAPELCGETPNFGLGQASARNSEWQCQDAIKTF